MVERPKVFFRDTGLLHTLMTISSETELVNHPRLGASWEGFALDQVLTHLNLREEEAFFWAVHTGAELDLVFQREGRLWGVEVKYHEVPAVTRSMRSALSELALAHIWVVYPGKDTYPLEKKITAIGLWQLKKFF